MTDKKLDIVPGHVGYSPDYASGQINHQLNPCAATPLVGEAFVYPKPEPRQTMETIARTIGLRVVEPDISRVSNEDLLRVILEHVTQDYFELRKLRELKHSIEVVSKLFRGV